MTSRRLSEPFTIDADNLTWVADPDRAATVIEAHLYQPAASTTQDTTP